MLPPFISDAKDNHPTFIFSVIRSRMLPPFITDAKDKHLTFILSVIRSRMLPSFPSDHKSQHPNEHAMKMYPYVGNTKIKSGTSLYFPFVNSFIGIPDSDRRNTVGIRNKKFRHDSGLHVGNIHRNIL